MKKVILLLVLAVVATGCAGTHGWQFQIGVAPVTRVDNHQGLDQKAKVRPAGYVDGK